jgi:hypothetical protein
MEGGSKKKIARKLGPIAGEDGEGKGEPSDRGSRKGPCSTS